jgi:hypothetical protein
MSSECSILSYVPGQTTTLKTLQNNIPSLQQPLALELEDLYGKIPQTIRDAIALANLLHERYLWPDSLCIVQDDEGTTKDQISKMASIYANAHLTIRLQA